MKALNVGKLMKVFLTKFSRFVKKREALVAVLKMMMRLFLKSVLEKTFFPSFLR